MAPIPVLCKYNTPHPSQWLRPNVNAEEKGIQGSLGIFFSYSGNRFIRLRGLFLRRAVWGCRATEEPAGELRKALSVFGPLFSKWLEMQGLHKHISEGEF